MTVTSKVPAVDGGASCPDRCARAGTCSCNCCNSRRNQHCGNPRKRCHDSCTYRR